MNRMRWMLNRLSLMSGSEVLWRGKKAVQAVAEARGYGGAPIPPAASPARGKIWMDATPALFDSKPVIEEADKILAGVFTVFALRDVHLGIPPDWNKDPRTGTKAPLTYGMGINYRDQKVVGNIKYLWEINRHYELVTLAQAARLTGDRSYARAACALVDSWLTECPYLRGQAWASALENAIRLLNWAVTWQLLHAFDADYFKVPECAAFQERWLRSVYQHCHFIERHLSMHSSANNHLFGEYMGLFVAAVNWPCWEASAGWRELARSGLEQEAIRQIGADGVNREQAAWYHHEVADMMLLTLLFGEHNGVPFSAAYRERFESMLEYIASVMDVAGHVPMIGDSDDAVMVRFSTAGDFNPYRSLLGIGAVRYGRADFKEKAGAFDQKCRWLTGKPGLDRYNAVANDGAQREVRRAFRAGGYYVLGHRFNHPDEVKIVADAGHLGYLSIAAHGHADALSITMSVGGQEILIDPGTYAYHTEPKWRGYFRGTSAHNTVRIDGRDQSVGGGSFLWLHKANAHCDDWHSGPENDEFAGCHDGYRNLRDPVLHRRRVVFDKLRDTLLVEDVIDCQGRHIAEIFWHFAETCQVSAEAGSVHVAAGNVAVEMSMNGDVVPDVVCGAQAPPLGWVSRGFDLKQPSPSVVFRLPIDGRTTCVTRFRIHQPAAVRHPSYSGVPPSEEFSSHAKALRQNA